MNQKELELKYNSNQLLKKMYSIFQGEHFDTLFEINGITPNIGYFCIIQMALHKQCLPEVLIGILKSKYPNYTAQRCTDMVAYLVQKELISYDGEKLITKYVVSNENQREIDTYRYPLPMKTKPKRLKDNTYTGYYTCKGSALTKRSHHEQDICLDHLNRINKVKLSIDFMVLNNTKNVWELDMTKSYKDRTKGINTYNSICKDVIHIMSLESHNKFHLTHKVDFRGRTYCQGYHINYQGNDWNRAVITLANKLHLEN